MMVADAHSPRPGVSSWCTAGVLGTGDARRFIGRLNVLGIDHHAVVDGDSIRVFVLRPDLDRALDLRPEQSSKSTPADWPQRSYRVWARMLVAIPCGGFLGAVLCHIADIESGAIPALTSLVFTSLIGFASYCDVRA
jgi:hypothetical protein